MGKFSTLKIIKAICFLLAFCLFEVFIIWNLRGWEWSSVLKPVFGLISWGLLWYLSSPAYADGKGVGRWLRPSGLLKAFLIVSIYSILGAWILYTYIKVTIMEPGRQMINIQTAVESFYDDYHVYPGPTGEITPNMIDELKGSLDSKINVNHTDYAKKWDVSSFNDRWGHPYRIRIDPSDPRWRTLPNVVVISCGPNGIFENGKGDDLKTISP
jgi:hypothetical protein